MRFSPPRIPGRARTKKVLYRLGLGALSFGLGALPGGFGLGKPGHGPENKRAAAVRVARRSFVAAASWAASSRSRRVVGSSPTRAVGWGVGRLAIISSSQQTAAIMRRVAEIIEMFKQ